MRKQNQAKTYHFSSKLEQIYEIFNVCLCFSRSGGISFGDFLRGREILLAVVFQFQALLISLPGLTAESQRHYFKFLKIVRSQSFYYTNWFPGQIYFLKRHYL